MKIKVRYVPWVEKTAEIEIDDKFQNYDYGDNPWSINEEKEELKDTIADILYEKGEGWATLIVIQDLKTNKILFTD